MPGRYRRSYGRTSNGAGKTLARMGSHREELHNV